MPTQRFHVEGEDDQINAIDIVRNQTARSDDNRDDVVDRCRMANSIAQKLYLQFRSPKEE